MPTLRALLAAHAPLLLIDAASSHVQVGWFPTADLAATRWQSSDEEAGIAVFAALQRLAIRIDDAAAFVFCDGPGSILGIRSVAVALRTWNVLRPRPVFSYHSLAVVAHALARDGSLRDSDSQSAPAVIADARRDSWHHYQLGRGLRRVPTTALAGDLVMPAGFRHWTPLPPKVATASYTLADLLPKVADADLFRLTDAPDAFLHEEPSYVTWTPQIHRAPS